MVLLSLSLVVVSMVISVLVGGVVLRLTSRWGAVDRPGAEAHKTHETPTSNLGGVGIFFGLALPFAIVLALVGAAPPSMWTGPLAPVADHLEGLRQTFSLGVGVLAAVVAMHVLGLVDDRRNLGPWLKLGVQLAVAVWIATFCDTRVLEFLAERFGPAGWVVSVLLTVLWLTVITNAMNFLDNMDGLTGGVGAIIAGLYLAAALLGGQWFVAGLAALLLGSLLGFLVWNFPPARMFMGDGGSLVLGVMLGFISIRMTYFDAGAQEAGVGAPASAWYGVLMPLVVMSVPLYDFASVCVLRLRAGRSPLRGDRNHFSHRLVRVGLSRRSAVLVIWLCTLATGLGGVMLGSLATWQAILAALQTLAVLTLLTLLEWSGATKAEPYDPS